MSPTLNTIGPVMLVGAGKMGLALARGWLEAGLPATNLILIDPAPGDEAKTLAEDYGLLLNAEASGLLPNVLVLAVKPQIIDKVMETLRPIVGHNTLAISIAAGIDIARLAKGLGTGRIVRTMPNTPAQIGKGITGAVAATDTDATNRASAEALLSAAGQVLWFDTETDLDTVTAISGSGPAYVFHLVEALTQAGIAQGLDETTATTLARQTVIGSAALLEADAKTPASLLRENVTSPNGTTAAGLAVLMPELPALIARTVSAARQRSEELGRG